MISNCRSAEAARGGKGCRVVVVGPCASGKTTLVDLLKKENVDASSVAQEHSNMPDMFLMKDPDYVIFLDVTYGEITRRRDVSWEKGRFRRQRRKLEKAWRRADLRILTDGRSPSEVRDEVLRFLRKVGERDE